MNESKVEISPPVELTQDESTLLRIASTGNSMMSVGRWEKPIEDLVKKGLLHRHDKFNHTITPAGREAIERNEDAVHKKLVEALFASGRAQTEIQECVRAATDQLVRAVQLTQQLKGDYALFALEQWASVIFREAKDKLDG